MISDNFYMFRHRNTISESPPEQRNASPTRLYKYWSPSLSVDSWYLEYKKIHGVTKIKFFCEYVYPSSLRITFWRRCAILRFVTVYLVSDVS
jgi:hypothetical protein